MQQLKKYRWRKKPRDDEPVLEHLSAIDHASQRNPLETQDCESENDTFDATADISFSDRSTLDHSNNVTGIEEPEFHGQEISDQVEVETESTPIQHLAVEISSNSFISINFVIDISVHSIQIKELYNTISGKTSVKFCVCMNSELLASIFVHRQEIRRNIPCWDGMPLSFPSAKSVELLMRRLSTFSVCFGNPDEDLQTLASVNTEITTGNSSDIVAFREGDFVHQKGMFPTTHVFEQKTVLCLC